MHDEAEVRLVEPHAQRRGGDQRLDPVGQQIGFQLFAFGGFGGSGVGGHLVALLTQQRRDVAGLRNGQGVDDARAGKRIDMRGKPSRALRRAAGLHHRQPQRLAVQPAAQHQGVLPPTPNCVATSATTRSLAVAVVASTGTSAPSSADQGADTAVVGPEVVAPVRDAVRLVDHHKAGVARQRGQHLIAKVGVVQPFRADQQDVEFARRTRSWISSQSVTLLELMVAAWTPARSAAATWLRISASNGDTMTVAPRPASRSSFAAMKYTADLPQPVRCTTSARRR